jgi:hypothetical protein
VAEAGRFLSAVNWVFMISIDQLRQLREPAYNHPGLETSRGFAGSEAGYYVIVYNNNLPVPAGDLHCRTVLPSHTHAPTDDQARKVTQAIGCNSGTIPYEVCVAAQEEQKFWRSIAIWCGSELCHSHIINSSTIQQLHTICC